MGFGDKKMNGMKCVECGEDTKIQPCKKCRKKSPTALGSRGSSRYKGL